MAKQWNEQLNGRVRTDISAKQKLLRFPRRQTAATFNMHFAAFPKKSDSTGTEDNKQMAPLHLQRILSQPQQLPSNAAPQEGGVTNCWYFYGVNYFARSQSIKKMFYRDLQKN